MRDVELHVALEEATEARGARQLRFWPFDGAFDADDWSGDLRQVIDSHRAGHFPSMPILNLLALDVQEHLVRKRLDRARLFSRLLQPDLRVLFELGRA